MTESNNPKVTDDLIARLSAPFPPKFVSWRIGALAPDKRRGMALAYIDARDVQDRLNEVCGVYWQTRHHNCGGEKLACDIGIKVGDEWLWRGDGAGATDVEAEKGSFSDSFKRAAVRWGVGRYLYDLDSPWVEVEAKGKTYVIPAREQARLEALLRTPQKPASAPQRPPAPNAAPPMLPPGRSAGSEERQLTLSQIRDRIMEQISKTSSLDGVRKLRAASTNDLADIADAHKPTADRLDRLFTIRAAQFTRDAPSP